MPFHCAYSSLSALEGLFQVEARGALAHAVLRMPLDVRLEVRRGFALAPAPAQRGTEVAGGVLVVRLLAMQLFQQGPRARAGWSVHRNARARPFRARRRSSSLP